MKKYYYSDGNFQNGPVTFEELKSKIAPNTYVWFDGLDSWTIALEVEELKVLFNQSPPKLPNQIYYEKQVTDFKQVDKSVKFEKNYNSSQLFRNPFSFENRIRRFEYGISVIVFGFLGNLIDSYIANATYLLNDGYWDRAWVKIFYIPLFWFFIAQATKRCHDLGKSGWWQLIPLYNIIIVFLEGDKGDNKYGSDPK
jgi:uncharacterized membrane protein YhaH (DUF805 family)